MQQPGAAEGQTIEKVAGIAADLRKRVGVELLHLLLDEVQLKFIDPAQLGVALPEQVRPGGDQVGDGGIRVAHVDGVIVMDAFDEVLSGSDLEIVSKEKGLIAEFPFEDEPLDIGELVRRDHLRPEVHWFPPWHPV